MVCSWSAGDTLFIQCTLRVYFFDSGYTPVAFCPTSENETNHLPCKNYHFGIRRSSFWSQMECEILEYCIPFALLKFQNILLGVSRITCSFTGDFLFWTYWFHSAWPHTTLWYCGRTWRNAPRTWGVTLGHAVAKWWGDWQIQPRRFPVVRYLNAIQVPRIDVQCRGWRRAVCFEDCWRCVLVRSIGIIKSTRWTGTGTCVDSVYILRVESAIDDFQPDVAGTGAEAYPVCTKRIMHPTGVTLCAMSLESDE